MNKTFVIVAVFMIAVTGKSLAQETQEYYDANLDKTVTIMTDEIIVKFKVDTTTTEIAGINTNLNVDVVKSIPILKTYQVRISSTSNFDTILQDYKNDIKVQQAEPNYTLRTNSIPDDTHVDSQWAIQNIELDKVWGIETGDANIVIAVLDTGIDNNHEDLSGNVMAGYDFVNDDNDAMDDNGHGTAVSGVIGAEGNNNKGIAGVNWNCKIIPVKVVDSNGTGSYFNIAQGILYAVDNNAKVLNLSIGGYAYSEILEGAIDYAVSAGRVIVAGIGDDNTDTVIYPAGYDGVIGVASTNDDNTISADSNYGAYLDIYAPGTGIYTTKLNDEYGSESGSSMASAYVAGLAGLILSSSSTLTRSEVESIIYNNSDYIKMNYKGDYGNGKINAHRAVLSAKGIENVDIAIMDFKIVPETPVNNQQSTITVVLQNQGNVASESTNVRLYIDETESQVVPVSALAPNETVTKTLYWTPGTP